jgi:5'-methylthioadenosine phosphorylase
MVIGNLSANVANAQRILQKVAQRIPADRSSLTCGCASALATAIITDRSLIPAEVKERYSLLIGKYLA